MSVPLEHDYIGLSESSSMERGSEKILPSSSSSSSCSAEAGKKNKTGLNLKATELRLGLPGFGKDLEEDTKNGFPLSPMKNSVSGSKRGFSDAIDGSSKWVFGGSEASGLYSPRGGVNGGLDSNNKTQSVKDAPQTQNNKQQAAVEEKNGSTAPAAKAQVVGWPPIRSYRKNTMASNLSKNNMDINVEGNQGSGCLYVKVSMDGAPYLRKVDLKIYHNYAELSSALEKMFNCFTLGQCTSHGISESLLKDLLHGSECVLTYEDKDGDWMLVGDVPWEMFIDSCRRLRIMKGSEAIGLAPRAKEKCKSRS